MRIRVEVGRTRVRTATKVILGVVAVAVAFLTLVNRDYLAVYDSPGGQVVLGIVGAIFATGGWLLTRTVKGATAPDDAVTAYTYDPARQQWTNPQSNGEILDPNGFAGAAVAFNTMQQ